MFVEPMFCKLIFDKKFPAVFRIQTRNALCSSDRERGGNQAQAWTLNETENTLAAQAARIICYQLWFRACPVSFAASLIIN